MHSNEKPKKDIIPDPKQGGKWKPAAKLTKIPLKANKKTKKPRKKLARLCECRTNEYIAACCRSCRCVRCAGLLQDDAAEAVGAVEVGLVGPDGIPTQVVRG